MDESTNNNHVRITIPQISLVQVDCCNKTNKCICTNYSIPVYDINFKSCVKNHHIEKNRSDF